MKNMEYLYAMLLIGFLFYLFYNEAHKREDSIEKVQKQEILYVKDDLNNAVLMKISYGPNGEEVKVFRKGSIEWAIVKYEKIN